MLYYNFAVSVMKTLSNITKWLIMVGDLLKSTLLRWNKAMNGENRLLATDELVESTDHAQRSLHTLKQNALFILVPLDFINTSKERQYGGGLEYSPLLLCLPFPSKVALEVNVVVEVEIPLRPWKPQQGHVALGPKVKALSLSLSRNTRTISSQSPPFITIARARVRVCLRFLLPPSFTSSSTPFFHNPSTSHINQVSHLSNSMLPTLCL